MKTYNNNLFRAISMTLMFGALITLGTGCDRTCIDPWVDCYGECPSQEEGDQAVRDCIDDCRVKYPNGQPIDAFSQCAVECYKKSREACVDRCGDQLQRCLDE
jgi:hypothetical protein